MKEAELRKHATCSLCGKKILASGLPLFWLLTVERFGVDLRAVQRQQGLGMMLGGNAALAMVMGPDEDLARRFGDPIVLSVCEPCGTKDFCVAQMAEMGAAAQPKADSAG